MTTPVVYLMLGLLFGTTFLSLGIVLGVWLCKRNFVEDPVPKRESIEPFSNSETKQILTALKSFATWTSDFAGDFSKYQSRMQDLSQQASDVKSLQTKEEVKRLLDQIVVANQELQSRLDNAEKKLEQQTTQLAGYLTEARTDGLTGLANRRAFDQTIDQCFQKWTGQKQVFSLALVDIDHFKKINDTYGHQAGDTVLKEVASRLKEHLGDSILVSRYGGEEFAILFSSQLEASAKAMEQFRVSMASRTVQAEGHQIKVTLSVGISEIAKDDRVGKVIRRSDEALYSAKMAGRNRVFVHTGKLCQVFGQPSASPLETLSFETNKPTQAEAFDPVEQRLLNQIDRLLAEEQRR